jgi:hypothetical protein
MNKHGIMTNVLIVSIVSLLIGGLLGAGMVEPEQVTTYVDLPGETVYVDVPGEAVTEYVDVADSRYDYWAERILVADACVNNFLAEWQSEIAINESGTLSDYDDYIEDGSEYEVSDYPNLNDGHRLLNDVTLSETDHEDNDWTCNFQADFENDGWSEATYNVSLAYEDGEFDDLTVTLA